MTLGMQLRAPYAQHCVHSVLTQAAVLHLNRAMEVDEDLESMISPPSEYIQSDCSTIDPSLRLNHV